MQPARIAHVVMPRPDAERPVLEFAWSATRALRTDPRVEVRTVVPVPWRGLRTVQNPSRRLRRASTWPLDLESRLLQLSPHPELVPFMPRPGGSLESAATAIARHLRGWPERVFGSVLDEGGYVAARVGQSLRRTAVAAAHGTDARTALAAGLHPRGPARRSQWTASRARLVAISKDLAQTVSRLPLTPSEPPVVVPFTVFRADFPVRPSPPLEAPFRLLFVGRLSREKGVDRLLQAFAQLPSSWRLELVGPEVDGFDVQAEVRRRRLQDRVDQTPPVPHAALASRYADAHALALPTRAEGLGNVLVEALLVGRPVIAAAVGGVPELVTREVGALAPDDDDAWPEALEDFAARVQAGAFEPARLREHAEPWTWEANAARLVDVILG